MQTLGLDLSLTHTGLCIIKDGVMERAWSIKSKPSGNKPIDELKRLQGILYNIQNEALTARRVHMVAIEGLAFMARNTTALVQLAGLNYMVRNMLSTSDNAAAFVIVAPTTLKKFISGKGNGDKNVMLMEIYKRWGETFIDDNEADAFGLAQVGQALVNKDYKLTQSQQEVIDLLKTQLDK